MKFLDSWSVPIKEGLFDLPAFRTAIAGVFWGKSRVHHFLGRSYEEACDICWLGRVSGVPLFEAYASRYLSSLVGDVKRRSSNSLRELFLKSSSAVRAKEFYAMSGNGTLDIFRDLIVIKEPSGSEKGVVVIKYTPTFDACVAFFDLDAVQKHYYIVLEPSWAGYCDPSLLLFLSQHNPVFVESPEPSDYRFLQSLNSNLVPLAIGSADWVDADVFRPGLQKEKEFDVVMVANWGRHKRHKELFRALSTIRHRRLRVLLIGFEWGGRTKEHIVAEANRFALKHVDLLIEEQLSSPQVADRLRRSRVFVLLSKKEGPNKAMMEAMFCDVPAIVYDKFIGGAQTKIVPETGMLSSYEQLGSSILHVLDHRMQYTPRQWALTHTGSRWATQQLNKIIRSVVCEMGAPWTVELQEKVNNPNLSYKDSTRQSAAVTSRARLESFLYTSRA